MLPALPTGMKSMSGASPRTSTISSAAVFCPSTRYGLMEFTRATGCSSLMRRAIFSASSKLPRMFSTFAPCATAWASFPCAMLPLGTRT